MTAINKLNNALHSINDAEKIIKKFKNTNNDSDMEYNIRKILQKLASAKQGIKHACIDIHE